MNVSSGTVVLASAALTITAAAFGQAQHSAPTHPTMNFYVTTPQTGESVPVGAPSNAPKAHQAQVASVPTANTLNTYNGHAVATGVTEWQRKAVQASTQRTPARAASAQPYTIQQVSNSPAAAYHSARATAPQGHRTRAAQRQHTHAAHNTNAGTRAQRQSIVNRLLHRNQASTNQRSAPARQANNIKPSKHNGTVQTGIASWYGGKWHGRKTANGERYDQNSLTAAHKTLPFGTLVKVRNERNGREVVVRINNRGPFKRGRIIDLSKSAASQIGMVGSGLAKVTCEVIGRS